MLEDTATTEEDQSTEKDEIEETSPPTHPYDMPGEWFVLNAQSGHEKKVKTNILTRIKNLHLEDKVYDVVIPTDEVVEIRNGKKVNLEKKTFPGYVLVRMDLDETTWYEIRNTPSIIGFVGSGKRPIALSRREIERILGSNEVEEVKKESPKFKPDFEVGETVRVTTGPFADFNGIIEEINLDQSKVTVLVNSAEIGSEIDAQNAQEAFNNAKSDLAKYSESEKSPEKIKAINELSKAQARMQASKN